MRGRKEGPGGGPKSDLKKINKENDTRTTLGVAEDQRNERKKSPFWWNQRAQKSVLRLVNV